MAIVALIARRPVRPAHLAALLSVTILCLSLLSSPATARVSPSDRRLSALLGRVRQQVACDLAKRDVLRFICPLLQVAGPGLRAIPPTLQPSRALLGITIFIGQNANVRGEVLRRTSPSTLALRTQGPSQFARLTLLKGSNPKENAELAALALRLGSVLKRLSDQRPTGSPALMGYLASLPARATDALRAAHDRAARNDYSSYFSSKNRIPGRLYLLSGALKNPARLLIVAVEFGASGEYISFYPVF